MSNYLDKSLLESSAALLARAAAELVDSPDSTLQLLDKVIRDLLIPAYRKQRDGSGDVNLAVEAAEKVVALQSREVVDIDALASRLAIAGRLDEALTWATRVVTLNPENAHYFRLRASINERLGRLKDAERDIVTATKILPDNAELQEDRSRISSAYMNWLKERRDSPAGTDAPIAAAEELVERSPSDLNEQLSLAETLINARRLEDALRCIDRALILNSDVPRLLHLRATTLERLGLYREAEQSIERAARFAPDDAVIQASRHRIVRTLNDWLRLQIGETADMSQAVERAEELVRRCPSSMMDGLSLAQLLAKNGRLEDALRRVEHAIELNDQIADAHTLRAAILVRMGRTGEAESAVDRSVALCREVLGRGNGSSVDAARLSSSRGR
jgi:Flp pilus assembly protein TadD